MFNAAAPLAVADDERRELEQLVRNGNCPQKVALYCKVLLANEGVANASIADQLKISRPTVLALQPCARSFAIPGDGPPASDTPVSAVVAGPRL
jgi:hypothetical protein